MPRRRTNRTCEICGKKEAHLGTPLFFANFPLDENRCREWVRVTGNEYLAYLPLEKLLTIKHICGLHFKKSDFNKNGNRLKKHSLSCLNLNSPLTDDQMIGFPLHLWNSHVALATNDTPSTSKEGQEQLDATNSSRNKEPASCSQVAFATNDTPTTSKEGQGQLDATNNSRNKVSTACSQEPITKP